MGVIELKRKHDAAAVNSSLVRRPIRRWAPLFMGPMLCAFAIGFVYPFCKGVYLSFCKFKTTSDAQFIGFGNYIKALNDASFVHSFWYTALFALVSLVFINVLAFAVAYALTQGIKGSISSARCSSCRTSSAASCWAMCGHDLRRHPLALRHVDPAGAKYGFWASSSSCAGSRSAI